MLFSVVNIISFYTGFFVGKVLAWRRGTKSETWITVTSVFSYTVFYPWFALMMLWFFGYKLGWFPIGKFLYPEKWYEATVIDTNLTKRLILQDGEDFTIHNIYDPLNLKMAGSTISKLDYVMWTDPIGIR